MMDGTNLWEYEAALAAGRGPVCGVDEAGRGPLAGPVYAAAVILKPGAVVKGLRDSKKLSEKRREGMLDEIIASSVSWAVASASVEEIEAINILQASLLAMKRAVECLEIEPALILIDGNQMIQTEAAALTVIKGDACCASIAAASVVAKVSRDRYMREMAEKYPQYGFEHHKGYGTKAHYAALREYGPCPLHRPSFLRKMH